MEKKYHLPLNIFEIMVFLYNSEMPCLQHECPTRKCHWENAKWAKLIGALCKVI